MKVFFRDFRETPRRVLRKMNQPYESMNILHTVHTVVQIFLHYFLVFGKSALSNRYCTGAHKLSTAVV